MCLQLTQFQDLIPSAVCGLWGVAKGKNCTQMHHRHMWSLGPPMAVQELLMPRCSELVLHMSWAVNHSSTTKLPDVVKIDAVDSRRAFAMHLDAYLFIIWQRKKLQHLRVSGREAYLEECLFA